MKSILDPTFMEGADALLEIASLADAINAAQRIARENGIAGYAIETVYGWTANARKPSLRYGKVFECLIDGKVIRA